MQVEYKGTQFIHKFKNSEGDVVYVTCSNEDFEKITEKPSLPGYEYQYSVGGVIKVDTDSGLLEEGQYTEDENGKITSCTENNGEVLITN